MDASASASAMPGGWDINCSQPVSAPVLHFTSTYDIKTPTMIESQLKSHLNAGLAPSVALAHNLGDYLANHSHRSMVGSNLGHLPPMIGLRTANPSYYMKEFVSRSEDIASLFESSRASRREEEEDVVGTDGTNLSAHTDGRFADETEVTIACLPQFPSRLLPILSVVKNSYGNIDGGVKAEERGNGGGNDDQNEGSAADGDGEKDDEDDDDEEEEEEDEEDEGEDGGGDDDDETASAEAWPGPAPASMSAAPKGMVIIRQPAFATRGSSPIACQDCGNQAKKDCAHMRCRTCCKNRGLECATHVRSTWVPAYKRRQRQQLFSNNADQSIKLLCSRSAPASRPSFASEAANPSTSHTSASTGTPPPSSDLNWSQQEGRFKRLLPMEVREQAVFKCVKISGVHDGMEEFAYQAIVKIGGHTYKGVLYDQGLEKGQSSASSMAELCLGGRHAVPSTAAGIDLAVNLHGTSESVLLEGKSGSH